MASVQRVENRWNCLKSFVRGFSWTQGIQGQIQGWVEGALATPFSLKLCSIFRRIKYLYSWPVKKGSGHPFLHFLNPSLVFRLATKSPNLVFQNCNKQRVHFVSYPIQPFASHCEKIRSQAFAHSFSCLAWLPESVRRSESVDGAELNGHLKIYSYQLQRNKKWHALETRPEVVAKLKNKMCYKA